MSLADKEDETREERFQSKFDLAAIVDRMDQTELVVALIAINPELEDILPEDEQLKRDVANIRQRLFERQLRLNDGPDSSAQVASVVQRHIHVHLWDADTSERLKRLGTAVVDLFRNLKETMVETKAKFINGDGRDVITFEEAYAGFKAGLRGMADFITRRDRSKGSPEGPWPADMPDKDTADPADPKIRWWGYLLGNFGAVPSKEHLEALHLKRDTETAKDVVRLASSVVDEVLDDELEPVAAPAVKNVLKQTSAQTAVITVKGEDTYLDMMEGDDGAAQTTFLDKTYDVPMDRFLELVSNDWRSGKFDLAEEFFGRDDELLKLVAELQGDVEMFDVEPEEHVITRFTATIANADEIMSFVQSQTPAKKDNSKKYSFRTGSDTEPERPANGSGQTNDDALYVIRSTTQQSPHYITDEPGKHTYDKNEAAVFTQEEAELLAGDHSDYAATKGYGYRYKTEEAGPTAALQHRAGASLSQ